MTRRTGLVGYTSEGSDWDLEIEKLWKKAPLNMGEVRTTAVFCHCIGRSHTGDTWHDWHDSKSFE